VSASDNQVSSASAIPIEVIAAMKMDFGCQVTGYLCDVEFDSDWNCLKGKVYWDARCRFACGAWVRTSVIRAVEEHSSGTFELVRTYSGSRYVICSWRDEEEAQACASHLHQ